MKITAAEGTKKAMDIFEILKDNADAEKAEMMSKYMKYKFPFLGIQKPLRAVLTKDFLKQKCKGKRIDWDFIFECYGKEEREFHYLSLHYIIMMKNHIEAKDLKNIEKLITVNSWWDSVDILSEPIGLVYLRYPEKREEILKYISSDNMWLRRISIIFQLKFKEKTDTEVLERAILANADTSEFFINKAIGWALREYSKTNGKWVREFISKHKLSNLSIREASKYI